MDKKFNGNRLKEALQFRELKMSELSAMTDISRQSLSLYANNENNPPYENVMKIAKELDFPYDIDGIIKCLECNLSATDVS